MLVLCKLNLFMYLKQKKPRAIGAFLSLLGEGITS